MQKKCLSYPVEFVEDAFGESPILAELLKKTTGSDEPRVLIVADMNVVQRVSGLGAKIGRYVQKHNIKLAANPVVVTGGEKVKADNLQTAVSIATSILAARLSRRDVVLAIGGGTILDVAGYAAAQTRGGVNVVRMPTTPAAMIDAAFAEYAAVNTSSVKDALRIPSTPAAAVCDTTFAPTVLDGVWRGGISEAVRMAVGSDAALMKKIAKLAPGYCQHDAAVFAEIVNAAFATRTKKGATAFGLWTAMRLESMSGYKLPHGYAVAIGVCADMGYSVEKGYMDAADRDMVVGVLKDCGALDGVNHSQHLLGNGDSLMYGLDAWALSTGEKSVLVPTGIGKTQVEMNPDRETYLKSFKYLLDHFASA